MAEKEIKTRIIHKHDVEANWKKAVGFIPKNAELIVYDADENNLSPRVKIGDGIKNVNDLNFFSGMSNWNASEGEPGHIENRTHYKEYKLISSTEVEDALYEPENEITYLPVELDYDFTLGKIYKIVFNNNTYFCECWKDEYDDLLVGGSENETVPFTLFVDGDGEEYNDIICLYAAGTPEPSIYVYEEEVVQLDREYLPVLTAYLDLKKRDNGGYEVVGTTASQLLSWYDQGISIVARIKTENSLLGDYYIPMYFFSHTDDNSFVNATFYRASDNKIEQWSVNNLNTGDKEKLQCGHYVDVLGNDSIKPVKTTGTGSAYQVTVESMTSLATGSTLIIIPHETSTSKMPTLKVNNFASKMIKRRELGTSSGTIGETDDWIVAGKPIQVMYNGLYWIVDDTAIYASNIQGTIPESSLPTSVPVIQSASVGQTIVVKAVDDNGMPTEWEAVDSTQPDWNAPEGESGYVLNRTHFKRKVSMLENAVCAFDAEIYYLPECGDLIVGDTYEITINGTSYTCKAFELDGCPWIGSEEYIESYDPSVPIPFAFTQDTIGSQIYGVYGDLPAEITVSLSRIEYEKIPTEYLPKFDWDATKDEPGHINNRTHWREFVPADTFDGDLTGREYIDFGEGLYNIKISDVVPTVSDFIGQTMVIHNIASNIDKEYILTANDITVQEADDVLPEIIVIWNSDFEIPIQVVTKDFSDEFGFTSAGVYFSKDSVYYTKSITGIKKYEYHPIDAKYLPEGVVEAATFIIHISKDDAGNYSADKTYDEIEEAYKKGLTLKCEIPDGRSFSFVGFNDFVKIVMFAGFVTGDGLQMAANGTINDFATITINGNNTVKYYSKGIRNPSAITFRNAKYYTNKINPSNTSIGTVEYNGDGAKFISGLPNPYALTINGTSYDGSEAAEFTGLATESYVDSAVSGVSELIGDAPVAEQINEAIANIGGAGADLSTVVTKDELFDVILGSDIATTRLSIEGLEAWTECEGTEEEGYTYYKISDLSQDALSAMTDAYNSGTLTMNYTLYHYDSISDENSLVIDGDNGQFATEAGVIIFYIVDAVVIQLFLISEEAAAADEYTPPSAGIWLYCSDFEYFDGANDTLELNFNNIPLTQKKVIRADLLPDNFGGNADVSTNDIINAAMAASY